MADTISSAIKIPELSSAPSNPPSGYQAIYAKTDNKLYMRTSAGTEIELSNVAGSGIGTLNTLTATTQTFATGTSGANFNISSTGSTHTFNIPDADTSVRGLITTGSQTFGGQKAFFNGATIGSLSGTSAGTLKISGGDTNFVSITVDYASNDWTLKLPTSAGSNGQVLTTNGSGVTSWVAPATNISDAGPSTRGLLSSTGQSIGGNKQFIDNIAVGENTSNTGQIEFFGAASGWVTLKVEDFAGTWTMTLPSSAGSSGQVLTTNGAGVTSWTTVSGGGGGLTEAKALMISSLRI